MTSINRMMATALTGAKELTTLPRPSLSPDVRDRLLRPNKYNGRESRTLSQPTQNPSIVRGQYKSAPSSGIGNGSKASARRYFAALDDGEDWPPELNDYNKRFARALGNIKKRHDSVVTTVGKTNRMTPSTFCVFIP